MTTLLTLWFCTLPGWLWWAGMAAALTAWRHERTQP